MSIFFRFRFRTGLLLAVLLVSIPFIIASSAAAQSGRPWARTPRLHVAGAGEPVRLVALTIRTEIQGGFAESSLEMEFHNPNRRVLEGELEFPLSPGQEISGLALDINGELRQASPVVKARGQEMFDDIVRRGVDPALLEAAGGNAYRLRVYPLPAGGKRRVVIRVMQPLAAEKGRLHYRLPLAWAEHLHSIAVEAEVVSPAGPVQAGAGNLGLKLERAGTVYRGRVERQNITPEGWLDISLPAPESRPASVTAVRWRDKMYFSAAAYLTGPDKARTLPGLVTILWDASGSGLDRDQARELALLDSYFKTFGSGRARLIVLRDKADPPVTFQVKNGDWAGLRAAIKDLVYDGATDLADWMPTADCREYLLFSDGLSSYRGLTGKNDFPVMSAKQRLFAINSALTADYAALRSLAVRGRVIDLTQDSPGLAEVKLLREGAEVSLRRPARAEAVLGPESATLSLGEGRNGLIRLAGWVEKDSGVKDIPVRVAFPDGTFKGFSLSLPAWDEAREFPDEGAPLPARLWGRYVIADLETDYQANRAAIVKLGQELGLVSRETSLIVLETAQDYANYDVTPPAHLRARVEALRRQNAPLRGDKNLIQGQLASLWRDKVKWWETDFDQDSEAYTGAPITLNFINKDVREIIPLIAQVSGQTIVIADSVKKGDITLGLLDASWDQALADVLTAGNLGVEESDGIITVYDWPTLSGLKLARKLASAEWSGSSDPKPGADQLLTTVLDKKDSLLLNAQISSNEQFRIISAPRIMAANDQTVTIKQGRQIPYKSGSSANTAANVQFKGSGISVGSQAGTGANKSNSGPGDRDRPPVTHGIGLYLKPWDPAGPALARLRAAEDDELYARYLAERPDYVNNSAFFVDVAGLFFERNLNELGRRVLSNLAEIQLENRQLLRLLAYRLMAAGEMAAARPVLERVRELAPYEPQSLRDLATVRAALGQYQEAVDLLYETARREWPSRFGDINTIALTEMNALIAAHSGQIKTEAIDSGLIKNLASDLRVVLSWDTDNTNLDLKIIGPDGAVATSGRSTTKSGGRLSSNCTQGYGPEEFILKNARPGVYRVSVKYVGGFRQQVGAGDVTLAVTVFSQFGTPEQKEERTNLRLKNVGDEAFVAELVIKEGIYVHKSINP